MEKLKQRTSQADVARAAGVSISTVSRVLSDVPGISEDVRRDVRSVAEQLGYRQRTSTRPAKLHDIVAYLHVRQATGSVSTMYQAIIEGIKAEAQRLGIPMVVRARDETVSGALDVPSLPSTGLMFVGLDPEDSVFERIAETGNPAILVNGLDPQMRVDAIAPANFFGGRAVANHLAELGHTRAIILSSVRRWTLRRRIEGFQAGLRENGIPAAEVIELPDLNSDWAIAKLRERLQHGGFEATAAFCGNDTVALGAIETLQSEGIRVPQDFSVVGFDDLPFADIVSPRITTIHVAWEEMGRQALTLLEGQARRRHRAPLQVQAGVRLVTRETTAAR